MKWLSTLPLLVMALATQSGCDNRPGGAPTSANVRAPADSESEVREALAKLPDEDRKPAEQQKYCVVQTDSRLGSMGTPVKVMVKDQPVFLCCKGCQRKALADPDKTLAKVEELKARAAGEKQK